MLNRYIVIISALILLAFSVSGQNCDRKVTGRVIDEVTGEPLSYVNVVIQELTIGTATDDDGNFVFNGICAGHYHLIFSHIGCHAEKYHLELAGDTILNIVLSHTAELDGVLIKGKKEVLNNEASSSVNRLAIEDNANKNLSSMLENETGVHLIKNGGGISKPVVHGLYGRRLTILNNGIVQSGQQWGSDHSPEIDPFSADKITVLKGANAIEFSGGNLGSAVLVQPKAISKEPHLHGQINYTFESNGRGNTINARLEKFSPILSWRANGTLKKYGDRNAANYFLTNTGTEEANFSIQLEKSWNEKLFLEYYISSFNTKLGILLGSQISNTTDLELALKRDKPYFTAEKFSYNIDPPRQEVSHHLTKLKAKYFLDSDQWLELVLAAQLNDRDEFDVRRNGKSDIPTLSLKQYAFNIESKYTREFTGNWTFKIGNQHIITDNTNNPETGILPLIPDYRSFKNGIFTVLSKKQNKFNFNIGARYDYEFQNVQAISFTLPRKVIAYDNNFHNFGAIFGVRYQLTKQQSFTLNSGLASQNPSINELYSNGLHQGVSGIEEGDVNLKAEKAIKNTLEYKWIPNAKFSLSALAYHQQFQDYIYLNPQDEIRLTIRGAFPVFRYEQTDARIMGLDISTQFMLNQSIQGQFKYSYLRGADTKNDIPLVYMPPNSLFSSLTYRSDKTIAVSQLIQLKELELEFNTRQVFRQTNLLADQDFVEAPNRYNLLGAKLSTNAIFPHYKLRIFVKADNLLNVQYRDYLNRQRYFADDLGFSLTAGINFKF